MDSFFIDLSNDVELMEVSVPELAHENVTMMNEQEQNEDVCCYPCFSNSLCYMFCRIMRV